MAKVSPEKWDKARALIEAGKSYREAEKITGINYRTIADRAKKEGWKPHSISQLITEGARIEAEIRTLPTAQEELVRNEITKQLQGMEFYSTHGRIVAKIALKSLQADMTPANAKTTMATLKDGLIVEGIVPFYPNAPQVNTQVNTTETQDKRRVFHVVE